MSFTLTVTASSRAEMQTRIAEFFSLGAPVIVATSAPQAAPQAAQAAPQAAQAAPQAAQAAPQAAQAAPQPGVVVYKDIADYVPKAIAKHGRGKIVTLLEGFGAKTGKDLKVEQYADVMNTLKSTYPL